VDHAGDSSSPTTSTGSPRGARLSSGVDVEETTTGEDHHGCQQETYRWERDGDTRTFAYKFKFMAFKTFTDLLTAADSKLHILAGPLSSAKISSLSSPLEGRIAKGLRAERPGFNPL
jgi:hypothetical protein